MTSGCAGREQFPPGPLLEETLLLLKDTRPFPSPSCHLVEPDPRERQEDVSSQRVQELRTVGRTVFPGKVTHCSSPCKRSERKRFKNIRVIVLLKENMQLYKMKAL